MKKFNFRLQKLLQLKKHRKLERQKELAKAERLRRMEEAHMETLRGRMKQELGRLAAAPLERVDVSDHVRSVYYQHRLSSNMATQQKAIRLAYRQEAIRREELLEAGKEEKMFVKLRERQKVRYLKELDSRNQKETDETAKNVFLKGKTS